nr:chromosomal replication initiator protein DnaA [Pseudoxanthomonas sp.]
MEAWPRCLERLEAEFPAEDIHTWLKPLQAEERADGVVLYAPNAFFVEQVRDRYLARIRELAQHFAGLNVALVIGSRPRPADSAAPPGAAGGAAAPRPVAPAAPFNGNLD